MNLTPKYKDIMSLRNLWGYMSVDSLDYHRIIKSSRYNFNFSKDFFKKAYLFT